MKDLFEIRKRLHSIAELSGNELKTSKKVIELLNLSKPDKLITGIGGYGIAAIFNDKNYSKTLAIRAELDALPIYENNNFPHKSITKGVSHKCGHDGHITILLGIARQLNTYLKDKDLRVVLLFQPAEETAQGALSMLNDEKFKHIKPDFIISSHNIPGYKNNSIIIRKGVFASASIGMSATLIGKTSHAGEPEKGLNPVLALTNIAQGLIAIPTLYTSLNSSSNVTIINMSLGEKAFGTSPGEAEISATFRSHENSDMNKMKSKAESIISGIAGAYGIQYKIDWVEYFSSNINDDYLVDLIEKAAGNNKFEIIEKDAPFPWSEDFGFFSQKFKSAYFGIGAGVETPSLHNADYDFPDEILQGAIKVYKGIINEILT